MSMHEKKGDRVDNTCYSFQTRKLKIVAVSFFCYASSDSIFFVEILLDFDSQ